MVYGVYTKASVISCNVSYKQEIDADTLVGILSGTIPLSEEWEPHLETFFHELPKSFITGVMRENAINVDQLTVIFESLPIVYQGGNFREMLSEKRVAS